MARWPDGPRTLGRCYVSGLQEYPQNGDEHGSTWTSTPLASDVATASGQPPLTVTSDTARLLWLCALSSEPGGRHLAPAALDVVETIESGLEEAALDRCFSPIE